MRASPAQAPVRVGAGGGQMLPEDDCWAMIMQCLKDEPAALCRCSEVCGAFHALCGNDMCQRANKGRDGGILRSRCGSSGAVTA